MRSMTKPLLKPPRTAVLLNSPSVKFAAKHPQLAKLGQSIFLAFKLSKRLKSGFVSSQFGSFVIYSSNSEAKT